MREIRAISDRLKEWRAEERVVCMAFIVSGDEAACFFVKGYLTDDSEFRIQLEGWGCAAVHLIGAKVIPFASDDLREAVANLSGDREIDWVTAMAVKLVRGSTLVIWSGLEKRG